MYDFSLNEGDSLNYHYPFHIEETDSVFYAEHWRKRYKIIKDTFDLYNPNQYPEYWIEGIGSTKEENGGYCQMVAQETIELKPGFHAKEGSYFQISFDYEYCGSKK